MFVQRIARVTDGIRMREDPTQQCDDLGELSRDRQKEQDDDEQIGKLGHQVSLGTSRAELVGQGTRVAVASRLLPHFWQKAAVAVAPAPQDGQKRSAAVSVCGAVPLPSLCSRNSRTPWPSWRKVSGSFPAPKTISTIARMMMR